MNNEMVRRWRCGCVSSIGCVKKRAGGARGRASGASLGASVATPGGNRHAHAGENALSQLRDDLALAVEIEAAKSCGVFVKDQQK